MLMSLSVITINGPIFIPPMSMPGICAIGLGEGLADGIGIFICICGDEAGVGDAAGICIPGMSFMGLGEGEAFGVGDGFAFCGAGIFMPGIS